MRTAVMFGSETTFIDSNGVKIKLWLQNEFGPAAVHKNENGKFTLFDSLPDLPSANDYVKITVGCDKKFQSCGEKFANKLNFQGFPHLPSGSVLLSIKDRI